MCNGSRCPVFCSGYAFQFSSFSLSFVSFFSFFCPNKHAYRRQALSRRCLRQAKLRGYLQSGVAFSLGSQAVGQSIDIDLLQAFCVFVFPYVAHSLGVCLCLLFDGWGSFEEKERRARNESAFYLAFLSLHFLIEHWVLLGNACASIIGMLFCCATSYADMQLHKDWNKVVMCVCVGEEG